MRKLLALGIALFGLAALGGIQLDTATLKTFTDCAAGGSAAQTVAAGDYLLTVNDEATWLCMTDSASTCASGGAKLPSGFGIIITIGAGGQSVSCRSTNSTGDLQFTKKNN